LTTPKSKSSDISFTTSSLCDQLLDAQLQQIIIGKCDKLAWRASEVREHFRLVWQREGFLLKHLFPLFNEKDEVFCINIYFKSLFLRDFVLEICPLLTHFLLKRYLHICRFFFTKLYLKDIS